MNTAAAPGPALPALRVLRVLCALPVALIVVLTFVDVFARYVFAAPVRGSVEIVQYAMAMTIFTALPLVTHARGHVTVSLIDKALGPRARLWQLMACDLVSLTALLLLTWRLWRQAGDDLQARTHSVVLGLPQAPLVYAMCLCALLSAGSVALQLAGRARAGRPA